MLRVIAADFQGTSVSCFLINVNVKKLLILALFKLK